MNRGEEFGEHIAEVRGIGSDIDFKLRKKEIKHIRRCIRHYSLSHDRDYPNVKKVKWDDLSSRIYLKFLKFGRLKTQISMEKKKAILKDFERKCSNEGCEEKENLTIAHIIPMASGMNKNNKGNVRLLCPKHHLIFDLKQILWRKGLEIEKLEKRIEDIEKRDTTDTLGMGILKDNKFSEILDEDEI